MGGLKEFHTVQTALALRVDWNINKISIKNWYEQETKHDFQGKERHWMILENNERKWKKASENNCSVLRSVRLFVNVYQSKKIYISSRAINQIDTYKCYYQHHRVLFAKVNIFWYFKLHSESVFYLNLPKCKT